MSLLTTIWMILLAIATFGFLAVSGFLMFLGVYARNVKVTLASTGTTFLFIILFVMILFRHQFEGYYPLITPFVIEAAISTVAFTYLWRMNEV